MSNDETIKPEFLLQEVRIAIKDLFIAKVHKCKDGINIRFPNGQTFMLALWEDKPKKTIS